jgi:methionyl-tRNA formyltransferase
MHTLIFFGSDQYSATALDAIIHGQDTPKITVVTDQKIGGTEVEKLAREHNLKISYYPDFPHSLITKDTLGLCASFDHLIPPAIIKLFSGNLYNLHPSLLPQYRNVSPVQYAIAMGDKETGITLFRISAGIDDGQIIAQATEPILPSDTTSLLTPRLFILGADLFLNHLVAPSGPSLEGQSLGPSKPGPMGTLIFTHRLTRDSGYIEWPVLSKLLSNKTVSTEETKNELLRLRLTHNPKGDILNDLLAALTPWPGVWSSVPTKKGDLRISLISHTGYVIPDVLISGKPKAISHSDFIRYYL